MTHGVQTVNTSSAHGLLSVSTYLGKKELKNLDKIAQSIMRSRSDTVRLMIGESIKSYAKDMKLKV